MSDYQMTLYEINKQLMAKRDAMSEQEREDKKVEMIEWLFYELDKYYMLLCHEQRDYTLLVFASDNDRRVKIENMVNEAIETLLNRGDIVDIDARIEESAISIWVKIGQDSFCYYLFPYNSGVIEV
ncbi:MAG: hypothetical protein RBR68_07595 [Tenuifilaceae bacterium]|nr:hypothetical protein [Tenuifilaceae bacterium]